MINPFHRGHTSPHIYPVLLLKCLLALVSLLQILPIEVCRNLHDSDTRTPKSQKQYLSTTHAVDLLLIVSLACTLYEVFKKHLAELQAYYILAMFLSMNSENRSRAPTNQGRAPIHSRRTPSKFGRATANPSIKWSGAATESHDWRTQQNLPPKTRTSIFASNPPNRSVPISRMDIMPGVIIRAPVHQQDYRGASRETEVTGIPDQHITKSRYGDIYSKIRKMIVVACYEDHFVAVPLYTHNGNGLRYKKRPDEFISVRDHRNTGQSQPLSKNGTLTTKELSSSVQFYDNATTAHITYPVSRNYNLDSTPEGYLEAASTQILINLVEKWGPKHMYK